MARDEWVGFAFVQTANCGPRTLFASYDLRLPRFRTALYIPDSLLSIPDSRSFSPCPAVLPSARFTITHARLGAIGRPRPDRSRWWSAETSRRVVLRIAKARAE